METTILVPSLGESVVEATVSRWLKKEGEPVEAGETLVELETDKVNLEVGAERAGVLARIERKEGEDVKIGDVLGVLQDSQAPAAEAGPEQKPAQETATSTGESTTPLERKPVAAAQPQRSEEEAVTKAKATPSARRLAQEQGVELSEVTAGGPQITRQDVQAFLQQRQQEQQQQPVKRKVESELPSQEPSPSAIPSPQPGQQAPQPLQIVEGERREERIRMSRRRRTIARRLVEAQQTAAMLTTYNEIDMTAVMDLRKRHKESFQKRYGVNLGIMSFFTKATIAALKEFPELNAQIDGDDIVYKHYYDIGIAVGAEEGLVVPVLRDADRMSFAEIEFTIKDFVKKSEDGALTLEELRGGTFTITNGGVFGSLLSTPILNPPQVGILGLHKIEERPVAAGGSVELRMMMYVALSYDHRIVDGRQSVQFLARIKHLMEDPAALLIES